MQCLLSLTGLVERANQLLRAALKARAKLKVYNDVSVTYSAMIL
jgi:hypothetical protein